MVPFSLPKKLKESQPRFHSDPVPKLALPISPVAAVAGGAQLCVYREGRVPCLGWIHRQQLGSTEPAWPAQHWVSGAVPAWLGCPSTGTAAPAGLLTMVLPLLSSTSQLTGPSGEFSLGETSLCFIWEIIKMKHGDFPCSVADLEQTAMTAAVLC